MKSLFLALVLSSSSVFASEILIDSRIEGNYSGSVGAEFKVNEGMGRAWVELAVSSRDMDGTATYERVKVPGLSLQNEVVVLDIDGALVECAYMRNVGIFRTRVAKPTGNCGFMTKKVKEISDDGFETRRVTVIKTYLQTY